MSNAFKAGLALLALGLTSACATVVNGTSQKYKISTSPKGAAVALSNGESCVSPCELKLKRKNHIRADVKLAGYKPTYLLIQSRSGGAVAGNLLLGGIIGGVVDSSNGANNFLAPNPFDLTLAAEGSADEATLRDKKGKTVSTVTAWNDKVRAKVAESLGRKQAGYEDAQASAPATTETVAVTPAATSTAAAPAATPTPAATTAPASGTESPVATPQTPAATPAAEPAAPTATAPVTSTGG